ncbi:uncharacterized protein LOC128157004 isoform X2 [Crassostrea angulata]|uniref:uncharacterized protein LOC128157004 isoform X2 n=1 Tax=Magallana angulata TaxID=2784310 RepID=UPI0022B0F20C|nr:uncharacterized protein LOC128157004 isoform X2 [Crassostrea angulata]
MFCRKMSPLRIMLLLATMVAIIEAVSSQPLVTDNVKTANRFGNDLTFYLMEQVYAMKPKLAALEAKTKEMELDLAVEKKQTETLQSRKDFRCESGVVGIHTNPHPSWPYTQSVTFQTPFKAKPTVTYGLYLLDTGYTRNTRVTTEVTDVTKTGPQVKLNTWADTELYGARISWMACGQ